jgi:heme-degrading monooxygenase HmoA
VIARIWKARVTAERANEYADYLRSTVVPELRAIHGYHGVTLLQRESAPHIEVTVITWWDSLEAVRAFAGEAVETAVVHDRAARMLIDFDRDVAHHQVVFDDRADRAE